MERSFRTVGLLRDIDPLLGFFVTINEMIKTFMVIEQADSKELAAEVRGKLERVRDAI